MFKHIFLIKFEIRILDLLLLPKSSVPFEGQYYSNGFSSTMEAIIPKDKKIKSNTCTRGDQKVRGKVLLNRIAFIDFNENS